MTPVNPERLMNLGGGFLTSQMLFLAYELGLFSAVDNGGTTVPELAKRLGITERGTRIMVDVLAVCGLLERRDQRYLASPDARVFLSGQGPADLGVMMRYWSRVSYGRTAHLGRAMRSGQPVPGELTAEQTEAFQRFVAFSTAPIAAALPAAYDFRAHRRLLDVGGGVGTMLADLLVGYPQLHATVVDLPGVVDLARASLSDAAGTAGRTEVVAADVLTDPLPEGNDVVLVAHLLHLFPPEQCRLLLDRLRRVSQPGTRLLVVDWFRPEDGVPEPVLAYAAVEFLLIGGGDSYTSQEMTQWLEATGWQVLGERPLTEPATLLIAEAA